MASSGSNAISSLYPAPPPYIKFFTESNVNKLPDYVKERQAPVETTSDEPVIMNELEYLIPPAMPKSQQYRAFGSVWQIKDTLPDLESMGITQLYKKSKDGEVTNYQYKIQELRRLLKSLLLNYLELVSVLTIDPSLYEAKVEHIRTILINIHHLLNEYRPHQSRESLIMLLEEQLEYKKEEIKKIEKTCEQVTQKLKQIQESLSQG
ncbi:mediator of RNA polymerase II transcription subunit 7 [Monosporozyma unispora]|nr:Mediator of RNA polymerase II transcription subunit 7 [Kazachstania unispora]